MSRLKQLIAELCPDGVEYKELREVLRIRNGKDYKHIAEGSIPVYGSGGIIAYINQYAYDNPSVLIPRKGSIDKLYFVDEPFWTVDTIFYTEINTEIIEPKFVFYYLQSQRIERLNTAGGVPSLTQTILNKILIPLPPLPVQQEIVRILDNFTELTTELTAELTAELTVRRKQYEYYRDLLLTFGDEVPIVKMGEIGTIERGSGLQKNDFTEYGVGCIHYGQIYTYYGAFAYETKSFVSPTMASKLKKVNTGDIIIAVTSENVEDVCKCVAWLGENEIVTGGHTAILKHNQNPKYISYYLQTYSFFKQKRKIAQGTKVIEISPKKLEQILIPLPSLEEQEHIVAILDRFDALCNDLTSGIPAEIEARQKQYEYYRDKLLTFKEVKA